MQGREVEGKCESARMCTCTLLHTWDRYDSNIPREYVRMNYAPALRFQAHIAHCHLDFLVYYSPARAFRRWITVLKLWLVLVFILPGGRGGRLHFFETQGERNGALIYVSATSCQRNSLDRHVKCKSFRKWIEVAYRDSLSCIHYLSGGCDNSDMLW